MKRKVDQIIKSVFDLANQWIDEGKYRKTYNTLRKLTKEVWPLYHKELLDELAKLDNPKADYQLFWLECLAFPPRTPNLFGADKMPLSLPYHALPSDFNDIGFHDSKIYKINNFDNGIKVQLMLDSWEDPFGEIVFHNASSFLLIKDDEILTQELQTIEEFTVLTSGEAPNIGYCLSHLKIPNQFADKEKRLFYFMGFSDSWDSIFIFADHWSLTTFKS
ncbi:hypothetical protein [Cohnella sp. GCM10012308]|uniref:hypothetical protein n=1 Tax=Cohnella sp. GCM10012308 TaxID=3317329 RepID=UPI0036114259